MSFFFSLVLPHMFLYVLPYSFSITHNHTYHMSLSFFLLVLFLRYLFYNPLPLAPLQPHHTFLYIFFCLAMFAILLSWLHTGHRPLSFPSHSLSWLVFVALSLNSSPHLLQLSLSSLFALCILP